MSNNQTQVYLSGKFISYDDILAPVSLYAYGAYTTIKYTPEGLLFLDKHFERLRYNCKELNIQYPSDKKILEAIKQSLDKNDFRNKDVIIRVTLFPEKISWAHPQEIKNTPCAILVSSREMYYLPQNFLLKTVKLTRHLPHLKTTNYVVNFLAKTQAREANCHDGLFINEKENITEGTAWNIFFIKDRSVYTPPLNSGLLEGITRTGIIHICKELNIELLTEKIPADSISKFDAAFITNSTQGPHGVLKIDNNEYDVENDLLQLIKTEYSKFKPTKLED